MLSRLSRVTTAICRDSRKITRRVCSMMAGMSLAMKFSFSPSPITTPPALPMRAVTILSGSSGQQHDHVRALDLVEGFARGFGQSMPAAW
jgi:hypothetical protein